MQRPWGRSELKNQRRSREWAQGVGTRTRRGEGAGDVLEQGPQSLTGHHEGFVS